MNRFTAVRTLLLGLTACALVVLGGCGFHLPRQATLAEALPQLRVTGDYHSRFFKIVVSKLRTAGVEVQAQDAPLAPQSQNAEDTIPELMLPSPGIVKRRVAVNSRGGALEHNVLVTSSATLKIPQHRPILMRNSLTRTMTEKGDLALAADNELGMLALESYEELATQLIMRLAYLGRLSDPQADSYAPEDLLTASDGSVTDLPPRRSSENRPLIEVLNSGNAEEEPSEAMVTLDDLNNGRRVLNGEYRIPPIVIHRAFEAPESVKIEEVE